MDSVLTSRKTDHYETPQNFLDQWGPFDMDPCPRNPKFDGLKVKWFGKVFVNPPYSQIKKWFDKCLEELENPGLKEIIFLIPARTDTKVFHLIWEMGFEVNFLPGRLYFKRWDGKIGRAPFPSMVVRFVP